MRHVTGSDRSSSGSALLGAPLLSAVVAVFALCTALVAPAAAAPPSVGVAPALGPPTTMVRITATGFRSEERVKVSFDDDVVSRATAGRRGELSVRVRIPANARVGDHVISATGDDGRRRARAPFEVRTEWTTEGFDSSRSGHNPYEKGLTRATAAALVEAWRVPVARLSGPAVLYAHTLYAATEGGTVHTVDAATGAPGWSAPAGAAVVGSPLIAPGRDPSVLVATGDGTLTALSASAGRLDWKSALRGSATGSPLLLKTASSTHAVVGTDAGAVQALDVASGELAWTATLDGPVVGATAAAAGSIFAFTAAGTLHALDAATGESRWSAPFDGIPVGYPVVSRPFGATGSRLVLVASARGQLAAYSVARGTAAFTLTLPGAIAHAPAVATLGGPDTTLAFVAAGESLHAVDLATGETSWDTPGIAGPVAVGGNVVYAGAPDGTLHGLAALTGAPVFTMDLALEGGIFFGAAVVNQSLAVSSGSDLAASYLPGHLDPSFSFDGKVTTDFSGNADEAHAIAIQDDGKIVVAGGADTFVDGYGVDPQFALARYNPDGTLDTSFGTDGMVVTRVGDGGGQANAVAIQGDGRIVAAGMAINLIQSGCPCPGGPGKDSYFALVRYNADGSLDTALDGDGKVRTSFLAIGDAEANAVAIQQDGKIVGAGMVEEDGSDDKFAFARYNPDGSLDNDFDDDGLVITDFQWAAEARAVAVQTDGKIVAAGKAGEHFAIARYNPNGKRDKDFDGDGRVTTDFGTDPEHVEANAVAVQADGRIVAAGGVDGRFGVARYNPDGSLDTTFNQAGFRLTSVAGEFGFAAARGVAIQADGKIVAAGFATHPLGLSVRFAAARYQPNGKPDGTFGGLGGWVTTPFALDGDAHAVAIQPDGRIVAAGRSGGNFALVRYFG